MRLCHYKKLFLVQLKEHLITPNVTGVGLGGLSAMDLGDVVHSSN